MEEWDIQDAEDCIRGWVTDAKQVVSQARPNCQAISVDAAGVDHRNTSGSVLLY